MEIWVWLLVLVIGFTVLVGSTHWISLFLGLEVVNFLTILYLLAGSKLTSSSPDSYSYLTFVYFLVSSFSTIGLLIGLITMYHTTGVMELGDEYLNEVVSVGNGDWTPFLFVSLMLNLGLAPFHGWVISVYNSLPTNMTFFVATVPNILYTILFLKLLPLFLWSSSFLLSSLLLTLVVGSILGIQLIHVQGQLNSLLGASSITNFGYLVIVVLVYSQHPSVLLWEGTNPLLLLAFYLVTLVAIFGLMLSFNNLNDLGLLVELNSSHYWVGLSLVVCLFSLIGMPPLLGFFSNILFFLSALHLSSGISALLIALLLLVSILTCSFYLHLVKLFYLDHPYISSRHSLFPSDLPSSVVSSLSLLLLLSLPLYSDYLYSLVALFMA